MIPNILSLDAPVVALAWQELLARQAGSPLRLAGRVVLGLTVWAIYLADRMLDVRNPSVECETARHQFSRRHQKALAALLGLVVVTDFLLSFFALRPAVFLNGLLPFGSVALYLSVLHFHRLTVPKELIIAALFTMGTFLIVWTGSSIPVAQLAGPAVSFFSLCLLNLLLIELWESKELQSRADQSDQGAAAWLNRYWFVWAGCLILICIVHAGSPWYRAVGISAAGMALIYGVGSRLSIEIRRTLVDAVLLSPLLFLL